ncbi:N-acetyltransferase [Actinomadura rubrisoli]|uniref:N-acetyltransferase n=2 Tax=Actinomadura rubrisoli TaxID=2530368 RepID=A0A4R5BPL3_9ACTN|nr:N-acetyltransferase [Actinomadura rubrisoli]
MSALLQGDLPGASAAAGVALTEYLMTDEFLPVWRIRINQLGFAPGSALWSAHVALAEPDGVTVGHAGFHGPPTEAGMVEIGYSVDPGYRRRGYAKAMLRELLQRAAAEPGVRAVRATISPGNTASLATIAGFGFAQVGMQWDEEDGLEIIFEVRVPTVRPG